jgi:hypothetical protein
VFFKSPAKVFRICIADIPCDGFDGFPGRHQFVTGGSHPLKDQVLVGRHPDRLPEAGMKM